MSGIVAGIVILALISTSVYFLVIKPKNDAAAAETEAANAATAAQTKPLGEPSVVEEPVVLDEEEILYTDPLTYNYIPYSYYATIPTYYFANVSQRRYNYPLGGVWGYGGRGGRGGWRGRGGRGGWGGRGGMGRGGMGRGGRGRGA